MTYQTADPRHRIADLDRPGGPRRPLHCLVAQCLVLALVLGLCACGGEDARVDALRGFADNTLIPAVTHLDETTAVLSDAVAALCEEPSEAGLQDARGAWVDAMTARATQRVVAIRSAGDRASMAALDWPTEEADVLGRLAEGRTDRDAVASGPASVRGLLTVEILLYGEGAQVLANDDVSGQDPNLDPAARCLYAQSATALIADEATRLAAAVTDDVAMVTGEGNVSMTAGGAIDEIINQQVIVLDDLADIWTVSGSTFDGPADEGATIVAAVGEGFVDSYDPSALGGALGKDLAGRVREAAESLVTTAQRADEPFDPAVHDSADALRTLVRTEVVSALDVVLTFSDSDGDSG